MNMFRLVLVVVGFVVFLLIRQFSAPPLPSSAPASAPVVPELSAVSAPSNADSPPSDPAGLPVAFSIENPPAGTEAVSFSPPAIPGARADVLGRLKPDATLR